MYNCCVFLGENHIVCVMAEQIMFRLEGKEKTDASTRPETRTSLFHTCNPTYYNNIPWG